MARAPAAAAVGMPRLSYAHLFSFQIAYSNNFDSRTYVQPNSPFTILGRKKGEWKRAILEVDFTMGTFFVQDKDRIVLSNTFNVFRRYVVQDDDSDDLLISLRFETDQWEIMVQNITEKKALVHLLECIMDDVSPEDAAEIAKKKGIVVLERNIMKYGFVYRRAKTAYKKDERFLIVMPGKLLLFKGMDITGKHARTVTSLFKATVRMIYGQLEFEVNTPNSKPLSFLPATAEDLTGWIGAIEKSIRIVNGDEDGSHHRSPRRGSQDSKSSRRGVDEEPDNKPKGGRMEEEDDRFSDEDKPSQRVNRHRANDGRSKGRHSINRSSGRYDMEERDFSSDGEDRPTQHKEKYLLDKERKKGRESPSLQGKNKSLTQQQGSVNDYQVGRNYNDVEEGYIKEQNTGYQRNQRKGHVGVDERVKGKYHERRGQNVYKEKKQEEEEDEEDEEDRGDGHRQKGAYQGRRDDVFEGGKEDKKRRERRGEHQYQGKKQEEEENEEGKGKGKEKGKERGKEEDEEDRDDGRRRKGGYQGRREDVFEGGKEDKKRHERRENDYQGKKQEEEEEKEKGKGKEKERGKEEDEEDRGDGCRWKGSYQGRREDVFEGGKEHKSGYENRGNGFQGRREDEVKQQKNSIPHRGIEEDGQRNSRQKGKQQGNYEGEEERRAATRTIGVQCQIAEDEKNQDATEEVRRRSKESLGPQIQRISSNVGRSPKEFRGDERKKKTQEERSDDNDNNNEDEEEEEEEEEDYEEEEPEEKDADGGYVVKGSAFIMPPQRNSLPQEEVVMRKSSSNIYQQGTTKGSISTLNPEPHEEKEVEEYPARSLSRPVFLAIATGQPLFNSSSKSAPMWASQQIPPPNRMNFSLPIRPPFPSPAPPRTQQNH